MPPLAAHERFYPRAMADAEAAAVAQRRQASRVADDAPTVGLALSGGGIRSATFCLGVAQAMARRRLIRRVDFLSTVSGGGYFGGFLGAAFSRESGSADFVESQLADNHSWCVGWLRDNGRFLSPNGAGDNWQAAAVALRNWVSLQVVLLTFGFFLLGLGALVRSLLSRGAATANLWVPVEQFFYVKPGAYAWWSPWLMLPLLTFAGLMIPAGIVYWLTQSAPLMAVLRRGFAPFNARWRQMTVREFISRSQAALTRTFTLGLVSTAVLLLFSLLDSLGQTAYFLWSHRDFSFPTTWTAATGAGALAFGFAKKLTVYLEHYLSTRHVRLPANLVALILALLWLLLTLTALSVAVCGFAWEWDEVWAADGYQIVSGDWPLLAAVLVSFAACYVFSRSFGFVNLSSLQQMYAARLARAYLGATNPDRQSGGNHDMTDLIPGDEIALEEYAPHAHGGPLHLVNVTVNETLSGKTQIERRDRKGLALAVGPCGLSAGTDSHALWAASPPATTRLGRFQALWDLRERPIQPVMRANGGFHVFGSASSEPRRIEALSVGRWIAISGAAFTTGTGANTSVGLSLLLGLANVRLGYWWDSGIQPGERRTGTRPNLMERFSRVASRLLPVQSCLVNEFFARFHGPARRYWYLSDGGHFENTACYELIRRRVAFIVCSDAGQDVDFQFVDFANLVRKARTDFGAEIQVARRKTDPADDDASDAYPMPRLEDLVHPALLNVIGVPEDFAPYESPRTVGAPLPRRHAVLARIHYLDDHTFSWLLLVKPSLTGDESTDVVQYQRTRPLFPQEPTTDQYFDEAQWESYRKLGEHIASELFATPAPAASAEGGTWYPALFCPPTSARGGRPAVADPAGRRSN